MANKLSDQSKRFIDAAREAGCDEDRAAFEKVFAKVVPPKQPSMVPKAAKAKSLKR